MDSKSQAVVGLRWESTRTEFGLLNTFQALPSSSVQQGPKDFGSGSSLVHLHSVLELTFLLLKSIHT